MGVLICERHLCKLQYFKLFLMHGCSLACFLLEGKKL